VLNLIPAFNLAATSWSTATLLFPSFSGGLLGILYAREQGPHPAWYGLGAGLAAAAILLTSLSASLALSISAILLIFPVARRHFTPPNNPLTPFNPWLPLIKNTALWIAISPPLLAALLWLQWQRSHAFPALTAEQLLPNLWLIPNYLRWLILISPAITMLITWTWLQPLLHRPKPSPASTSTDSHPWLMIVILPLAVVDLLWHSHAPWPDATTSFWILLAIPLTIHRCQQIILPVFQDFVSYRTLILISTAAQTLLLINTDFPRAIGYQWPFQTQIASTGSPYTRFFTRDPSGRLCAWKKTAQLVQDILLDTQMRSPRDGRYFVVTSNWQLAAALNRALPPDAPLHWPSPAHPRVQPIQSATNWSHPFAFLPRYDARSLLTDGRSINPYAGKDAIYISDSLSTRKPPPDISNHFASTELLTITSVIHAGQPVRHLKIFACYDYRPPQW
jgi:hypothetical protein